MPGQGRQSLHEWLVERFGDRAGEAIYTFAACLVALAASGMASYLAGRPLLFPSLGPTALLFFGLPMAPTSSPRNAVIGHTVAILAGALSLALFGLLDNPSVLVEDATPARIGAGALSVALTGAVLLLLDAPHPPTGATTLIVSLGFLQTPAEMAALMAGVGLLTVVGWLVNRAAGVPVPVWSPGGPGKG